MNIEIFEADYHDPRQASDLSYLLDSYATDTMGGGKALSDEVKNKLATELSKLPNALSILCYVDDKPAGLANCFIGYSTFKCKPLLYIHDLVVLSDFRGLGLSQKMLQQLEKIGKKKDCCKLTLEVLEGNIVAQNAYRKFGFSDYELGPELGKALFWEKDL